MRRPLNAGSAHGPAWNGLLLTGHRVAGQQALPVRVFAGTACSWPSAQAGPWLLGNKRMDIFVVPAVVAGTLLASCICPASSELPSSAPPDVLTERASAHLPVPRNLDGTLSTSWFRGHEAQQEAMVSSPEGRPGPGHTDAGSDTAVLDTSRGRRSVTEQTQVKALVLLHTFPETSRGVVQSELNYSVVLSCLAVLRPTPVIHWTFNGQPRGTGEKLIIRRLSREDLGTYMCVAKNSQEQLSSELVKVSLSEVDMDSADEPAGLDPILTVSGGSAIALLLAGCAGLVVVMVGIGSAIAQTQRTDRQRIRRCC